MELASTAPVETAEWQLWLGRWHRDLLPHLVTAALPRLGEVVYSGTKLQKLPGPDPVQPDWKLEGLFGDQWTTDKADTRQTWVLTRTGTWQWLRIELEPHAEWVGQARPRRLIGVALEETTALGLAESGLDLRQLCGQLTRQANAWLRQRQVELKLAARLAAQLDYHQTQLAVRCNDPSAQPQPALGMNG